MNKLSKKLIIIGALVAPIAVSAAPFDHPCEVVYWEINKPNPTGKFTLENYNTCIDQFGDTKLIRDAETYKEKVLKREQSIEERLENNAAIAKGEREGKIVISFGLDSLLDHPKNPTQMHYAYEVYNWDKDKTYKTEPDALCKQLGFDSSVGHTISASIDDGSRRDLEDAPTQILELRKKGLFSGGGIEPIVHTLHKSPARNAGNKINFYTSVTCERLIKMGEAIQDFDIDMEAIRIALEQDLTAPKLKDEVARILSLGRMTAARAKDDLGEMEDTKSVKEADHSSNEGWRTQDYGNNEFIYRSSSQ